MTAPATPMGHGPCPYGCGSPVVFRRTSGGYLRFACSHCLGSGYAEHGGPRFTAWNKAMTPYDQPASAPAAPPKAKGAADPAPAQAPARGAFNLGQLLEPDPW